MTELSKETVNKIKEEIEKVKKQQAIEIAMVQNGISVDWS